MGALKRKLSWVLIVSMVFSLFASGWTIVQAAEGSQEPIVFETDLGENLLQIQSEAERIRYTSATNASKLTLENGTLKGSLVDTATGKLKKDTYWDALPEGMETLELSWVGKTKKTELIFEITTGGAVSYASITLDAQKKDLKILRSASAVEVKNKNTVLKVDGNVIGSDETGYLCFYEGSGNNLSPVSAATVEWRRGTETSWKNVSGGVGSLKEMMPAFMAKGVTLYFRTKAVDAKDVEYDYSKLKWPSKAVKYSFKKQANAPAVSVNVSKHTIALKKGQEYRIFTSAAIGYGDWVNVLNFHPKEGAPTKVDTIQLEDLIFDVSGSSIEQKVAEEDLYTGDMKVQVRTAATNKATSSKTANISVIPATTQPAILVNADEKNEATSKAAVTMRYTIPYDEKSGITITNSGDVVYEFAFVATGSSVDAATKWTKLKANKAAKIAKIKEGAAKPSYALDGSIYIRMAGDSKKGEIAGKPTQVLVSSIKQKEQRLKTATVNTVNGVKLVTADLDSATPATITVTMNPSTAGALTANLSFAFTGIAATKDFSVAIQKLSGSGDGYQIPDKMTVSSSGNATLEIKAESKEAPSSVQTTTYEIVVQGAKFNLVVVLQKAS